MTPEQRKAHERMLATLTVRHHSKLTSLERMGQGSKGNNLARFGTKEASRSSGSRTSKRNYGAEGSKARLRGGRSAAVSGHKVAA